MPIPPSPATLSIRYLPAMTSPMSGFTRVRISRCERSRQAELNESRAEALLLFAVERERGPDDDDLRHDLILSCTERNTRRAAKPRDFDRVLSFRGPQREAPARTDDELVLTEVLSDDQRHPGCERVPWR